MNDDKIHVGLATDDNYVDFAMIVANSIAVFHPVEGKPVVVHLFTNALSSGNMERLLKFAPDNITIVEHIVDPESFAERWCGKKSPTYYRLEMPEMLPDIDRLIYLDCDMVVLDDIEKLWNLELDGCVIGAVGDRAGLQEKRRCYAPNGKMFNAGLLLLDMKKWRELNVGDRLRKFWKENQSWMRFADQGLLNACFSDNYKLLPQKWNIINSTYRNPPVPGVYTDEDVINAISEPGIVHFTGHHKPWKFWKRFHHPYGYTFCKMALRTPICVRRKMICWLKLVLNGRFIDSSKERTWDKSIIRRLM